MTAPTIAPLSPDAIRPTMAPTASQTSKKPAMTMMLLRLLREIWWYTLLGRLAFAAAESAAQLLRDIAAPYLRPDEPVSKRGLVLRVVLEVVGPHGPMSLQRRLPPALGRRWPGVAPRGRGREIEDLPAAELQPVAEVEVLAEHEVARVEEADAVQRGSPQHQAGRGPRVHLVDLGLADVSHVVPAEPRARGKELAEPDGLIEQRARDRKRAARVGVEAPAGKREPRSDRAG